MEPGLQEPLARGNWLEDMYRDMWVVRWPVEVSMYARVLVLTSMQTFVYLLFVMMAVMLPLDIFYLFTYLLSWTSFLALLVIFISTYIFQAALDDAPGLGYRLFLATTVCEGLAYLLLLPSIPNLLLMFMAFSCAGHISLTVLSIIFTENDLKKYSLKVTLSTLVSTYLIVITAYPVSYIFLVFILPVNCMYLVLSVDDAVDVCKHRYGRWKEAANFALRLQTRKFAYPLKLLPARWKNSMNDFLPIERKNDEESSHFDA